MAKQNMKREKTRYMSNCCQMTRGTNICLPTLLKTFAGLSPSEEKPLQKPVAESGLPPQFEKSLN